MSRRKPDRRALEAELREALVRRGATEPSIAELDLLHRLGEAYGCFAPRKLERANELYEQALRILWKAEGDDSLKAMPILSSWLDCARARREHLSNGEGAMLDRSIGVMRGKAEALLAQAEPKILGGAPGGRLLFSGAYTLLQRMGEGSRAIALLHATSPNWAPAEGPRLRAPR